MHGPSAGDGAVGVVVLARARVFREGLAEVLGRWERLRVVGTAQDWGDVAGHLRPVPPDVLLVDAELAAPAARVHLFRELAPRLRFIAVGVPDRDDEILRCLEAGMCAYVTTDASVEDLVETIERATSDELLCPPRIAAALSRRLSELAGAHASSRESTRLTTREVEILHLLEQGLSNQQIAARLFIEVPTVKNHVHNILAKLHVHRRGEAANWMRNGELALRLLGEPALGDGDAVGVGDGEEHGLARQH